MRFPVLALWATCAACAVLPAVAQARTTAHITVAFAPDVAGVPTTVTIGAVFKDSKGGVPTPIRKSVTHLPPGIETDLAGVTTCSLATLELEEPGAGACPESSLLGAGSAFAEVALGGEPISGTATVTAVLGSSGPGRLVLYLDGEATYPVTEQIIAKGTLTGNPATGQTFTVEVPPIPSDVGGPNVSVVNFKMSLGRQKVLSIHPHPRHSQRPSVLARGIVLPRSCPRGKLFFPTTLFFQGGGTYSTTPTAPCPRR